MTDQAKPLAIVTGASSGIGLELAKLCAEQGYDLVVAADRPELSAAAETLRAKGAAVTEVQADLSTEEGVDRLCEALGGRRPDVLMANAGEGLGGGFLDQDWRQARHVIETNVVGTLYLAQKIGRDMRSRGQGRILFTGSIAGLMPGSFQAVYNGTKAFVDSFALALRNELKDTGVTVTCLMPGATETEFFEHAGMQDTKIGSSEKDDPADVAKTGFEAMMKGEASVVHGMKNKIQAAAAAVLPDTQLAETHRKMAEPGGAHS